eukprot:968347_1
MAPINIDNNSQEEQIELQQISNDDNESNNNNNNNNNNDADPSLDNSDINNDSLDCDFAKLDKEAADGDDHSDDSVSTKENSEHHQLKSYQNGINNDKNDIIPDDDIIIDGNASLNPLFDPKEDSQRSKCITRIAAFVAGIFHGIAGPGGVLGVMVALKLNDWFLSSLYLILFFMSSIITMGIYAIIYGYTTQRMTVCANNKQKCAFILKFVSAIFSLIIGV